MMKKIVEFAKSHKSLWMSIVGLGLIIYVSLFYDEWVDPSNQSFSARSRTIKALFLFINEIGGKPVALLVLIIAELIYLYSAYQEFKKPEVN